MMTPSPSPSPSLSASPNDGADGPSPDRNTAPISTSPARWFGRGWLAGAMACATANAMSYFVRSGGWGELLQSARQTDPRAGMGFPFAMWEAGNNYGGYFVDYPMMLANLAVGAAVGVVVGAIVLAARTPLNRMVDRIVSQWPAQQLPKQNLQFSIKGLLLWTIVVALICAIVRTLFTNATARDAIAGRREVLAAIYLAGPWLLVSLALLPRRIPWQHRVALIIPLTLGLILMAVAVGTAVGRSMEEVLMGIYVCWTPQTMLAAVGLTIALTITHHGGLFPSLLQPNPRVSSRQ